MFSRRPMPDLMTESGKKTRRIFDWACVLIAAAAIFWIVTGAPNDDDLNPGYIDYRLSDNPTCPDGFSEPVIRDDGMYRCYELPEGK